MLEFEETNAGREQAPMKAEVNAPAGFVVIPLEQYNELLIAAEASYIPVKVSKETWNGGATIIAEVDKDWLCTVARELLKQRYSPEELAQYDMVSPDDVYSSSITIAKRRPQEPDPF